jgi:RHH-type proline utilization regulon transcriptional repressor/proline dehydrogenase/delta 1-pyrroline-5-carboxylate dehydrogenase
MTKLQDLRSAIRDAHISPEDTVLKQLALDHGLDSTRRGRVASKAANLVRDIRKADQTGLMEVFLAEYGLSTDEGIALMCLAEALLRVPDAYSIDELIEDKIAPSNWSEHLGHSSSHLVNASTWALLLTGQVLRDGAGITAVLRGAIRRLGEPVIRTAVGRAMKELGAQFVLGESIDQALKRGRDREKQGYTFSYDMLGEAAMTARDADAFFAAYANAIRSLSNECDADDIRTNPGISIKLSALHPRYERGQSERVMEELVPRTRELARMAKSAGMGLNIDAEEADRLDLSLDIIEAVLRDPKLAGWDGFGVVVQAYSKRAAPVLDWLYALAKDCNRRIMVRLVKGAYWDAEVKRAQVEGLVHFPVYTRKSSTDQSYLCCAQKLLDMTDRIYPQFATHNAHSVAAILDMAGNRDDYEFQRLHGMGEALHDMVLAQNETRCRIYAPVGAHRDLLAYLVRRLLENGANSSFVNQIVDEDVPPETVAADPFAQPQTADPRIAVPADLFQPERPNSPGWDLHDPEDEAAFDALRAPHEKTIWHATPLCLAPASDDAPEPVTNPADPKDRLGTVQLATPQQTQTAIAAAAPWTADQAARSKVLNTVADLYEENAGLFFALLTREAGKTPKDGIAELREAIDFLRYYAARAALLDSHARGVFACISPWNFPLAIFTGQIAAALAAGNGVLAKPAEATPLIAHVAVSLMLRAGVPPHALQLLPGHGSVVGAALSFAALDGVCFTGSTATAQAINRSMAKHMAPDAPLIAETGGLNAMIVDSTALPEQAVRDIVISSFQSAGQRCSALRVLYLQEDIVKPFMRMLSGAMDELIVGHPWSHATDVGPVIDATAQAKINAHIAKARSEDRLVKQIPAPKTGTFVGPAVLRVSGIDDLEEEIFGPVLHVATYKAEEIDTVVDRINASGFGLTFGMHSRIDGRIEQVIGRIKAGNIYINRNQIGAIVGSQPFGGEGLSGTGPKAGGPNYLPRFARPARAALAAPNGPAASQKAVSQALAAANTQSPARLTTLALPGPTGESNQLTEYGRGVVLCLGPDAASARHQAQQARDSGAIPVLVAPGLSPAEGINGVVQVELLSELGGFAAVASYARDDTLGPIRQALAARQGPIIPILCEQDLARRLVLERHVCIDTTAAGGNATLLAELS